MRDDDLMLKTPDLEFGSGVIGVCDICGKRQAVIVLQKERYKLCVIDFLNKTWTGSEQKPGAPLPPYRSETVSFPTDAVPSGAAYALALRPTKVVRHPGILITPEVYGITTALLDAAIHFAREGFEVLVPDLGKTSLFGPGDHLSTRIGLRTKGGLAVTSPRVSKLTEYYADALTYLRGREMVDPDRTAVFGLSYGGSLALALAGLDQKLTAVAVAYPAPLAPPDALTLVTAKVFFVAGTRDKVAASARAQLEKVIPKQVEFDAVTEVGHDFLSRDLRAYDQNRAEATWAHIVAFYKRLLMPPPPKPPTPPVKSVGAAIGPPGAPATAVKSAAPAPAKPLAPPAAPSSPPAPGPAVPAPPAA
jgi:dienelactone hydrolase